MDRTPQRSCAARGLGCSSRAIIQAMRVCVREKMAGKGQDDAVVPQGAAVPRERCRGQTENNHPAPTEGGEPRPAIKCAMPQCLAWTSTRRERMPWAMSCTRTSGRDQGLPRRMPATSSGPTHPTSRGTPRVARPGADVARRRAAAAQLDVANEGECVRLLPGLRPRVPTAVDHRGLDGSTIETTTPP